ncbi:asparaginase [Reinekea sp.]|jgi:L-asparaginase II|uniref:asparaginase n=3 Tax=Reinekea sp. TaxID=1970455 RepID=UPI0039898718
MSNPPIQVNVMRGGIIESAHQIKAIVVDSSGETVSSWGDMEPLVYPRSAIKALQALAFMERGGAQKYGFNEQEIAILCASHNGEKQHTETVQKMLAKLWLTPKDFECGHHWPMRAEAGYELASAGLTPNNLHNNCSGKHAGMLGLAKLLQADHKHYIDIEHAVQKTIAATMAEMCEIDFTNLPHSPDGCSAPTWAIPLYNLALGFAKFADPAMLTAERKTACNTLFGAVVSNPFMVAGTGRYCTEMMQALGQRVFLKVGAEGVYIAAIPDLKLAVALKCEDGAARGAESVMTAILERIGATDHISEDAVAKFKRVRLTNWNKLETGEIISTLSPNAERKLI